MKKFLLYFMFILLFLATGAYITYGYFKRLPVSYIKITINPEVELGINTFGEVVEVVAINEDADVLLADLDLIGMPVEEASETVVDAAVESGYIDEYSGTNVIGITTASEDENERLELQERVRTNLNNHLEEKKVYAVIMAKELGDELKAEAETYGVSNGKMLLIEEAANLNENLDKKELADMTVREIQALIKESVKERYEALKDNMTTLKANWKEEKEVLKDKYQVQLEQAKEEISSKIENFNNLSKEEKIAKVNEAIEVKKEQVKNAYENWKNQLNNVISDWKQSQETNQEQTNESVDDEPVDNQTDNTTTEETVENTEENTDQNEDAENQGWWNDIKDTFNNIRGR